MKVPEINFREISYINPHWNKKQIHCSLYTYRSEGWAFRGMLSQGARMMGLGCSGEILPSSSPRRRLDARYFLPMLRIVRQCFVVFTNAAYLLPLLHIFCESYIFSANAAYCLLMPNLFRKYRPRTRSLVDLAWEILPGRSCLGPRAPAAGRPTG